MTGQVNVMSQALQKVADREGKYLTFSLDREEYGIRILRVKEIIGIMRITPIPQTPEYMKGVINLRGKVIPVIDLRARFGMDVAALRRAEMYHCDGGEFIRDGKMLDRQEMRQNDMSRIRQQ